jgi:hypothetical protein
MPLKETQILLARLFTDADLRRAFAEDPVAIARRFGLNEKEAREFARVDQAALARFAQSLLSKRALDARKALPLTARVLGDEFERRFFEAVSGPPAPARYRADAAALARRLAALAEGEGAPAWIGDLARYELAFVAASHPGAVCLFRRFRYPVARIASTLLLGGTPDAAPRTSVGVWLRAPGTRLFYRFASR